MWLIRSGCGLKKFSHVVNFLDPPLTFTDPHQLNVVVHVTPPISAQILNCMGVYTVPCLAFKPSKSSSTSSSLSFFLLFLHFLFSYSSVSQSQDLFFLFEAHHKVTAHSCSQTSFNLLHFYNLLINWTELHQHQKIRSHMK